MKVNIPEGRKGEAEISHFTIDQQSASRFNMSLMMSGHGHRRVVPGTYTRLTIGGKLVMSDTPAEQQDHYDFRRLAHGRVLITGLGLGMIANAVAEKEEVESVTVIEISQDVFDLVGPHLHPKVEVIIADAHTYKFPRGTKFDCVWNDIWADISPDDAESRAKLNRKFGAICTDYRGCWADPEFKAAQRSERSYW